MTSQTATGIGLALGKKFSVEESPARIAWAVHLLKVARDREQWFPHGKWATIQHLEQQLGEIALVQAKRKKIL